MLIEVIRVVVSGWGCGEGHRKLFFWRGVEVFYTFYPNGGPRVKTFVQIN